MLDYPSFSYQDCKVQGVNIIPNKLIWGLVSKIQQ